MTKISGKAVAVASEPKPDIDPLRARHLQIADRMVDVDCGVARRTVDDAESPLMWLARRRGRDNRALIEPHQLQAGERLRAEFTRAQLMPRTTSNWSNPVMSGRRQNGSNQHEHISDAIVSARQRVRHALDAVGPEFSGLLLDVCCFLKRLEDIERERAWPARSAKVVLQLGLDQLARHFGYSAQASGPRRTAVRTWLAPDAVFSVD
jgi:hypothetical protein